MRTLPLRRQGTGNGIRFGAERMVNLGYVGRDQRAVRAHIDELAREGVPPPASVPMFIPLPLHTLIQDETIDVIGPSTSGEVEAVLFVDDGKILVGVGSDHTDRALERDSMALSKAVCPNVIGPEVWELDDIHQRWDDLVLRSFVRRTSDDAEIPYQSAPLRSLMPLDALLDFAYGRLGTRTPRGLVLYCGTVPVLTHGFVYGAAFRGELVDEQRKRTLSCSYQVTQIAPGYDRPATVSAAG
jgi:hypothetical protein